MGATLPCPSQPRANVSAVSRADDPSPALHYVAVLGLGRRSAYRAGVTPTMRRK